MLCGARSIARLLASINTAPLLAVYAAQPGKAMKLEFDPVITIDPLPLRRIDGTACLAHRNGPRTFTANTRSQSSAETSQNGTIGPSMPALAWSTDTGSPKSASIRPNAYATPSLSLTSHT